MENETFTTNIMLKRTGIKQKTHRYCKNSKCKKGDDGGVKWFKKRLSTDQHCCDGCKIIDKGFPKRNQPKAVEKKVTEKKPKEKNLAHYKKVLQFENINLIVRLIDKGHPCIAENTICVLEAGHLFSVGSNSTLRYHLLNIWGQSKHSNQNEGGDQLKFKQGIINLYGKEFLEQIESLQRTPPIKLTIPEIQEKISICKSIISWLKLQDRKFTTAERWELRLSFNHKLNIYI